VKQASVLKINLQGASNYRTMKTNLNKYKLFGDLLCYPTGNTLEMVGECINQSGREEAIENLKQFESFVRENSLHRLEEIYTRTFHIQAICYLDLGYVLFGEDYKRGEFLVNMKREQELAGNDCGDELADNLSNVLTLLPKIKDVDFLNELVARVLLPALEKMLKEFESSRIQFKAEMLRKKHKALIQQDEKYLNIYQHLLRALQKNLQGDFEDIKLPALEYSSERISEDKFLESCGGCQTTKKQKV